MGRKNFSVFVETWGVTDTPSISIAIELESFEPLDIYHPGNGSAHLNFDGGGDKGADRPRIRWQDIDVLFSALTGLVDQGENSFDVLVVGPNQQRYVPLPKEAPR